MSTTENFEDTFNSTFNSVKEILKNEERHLYMNALNLFNKTVQTSNTYSQINDLIKNEHLEIFCMQILPLIFDNDKTIQDNAIIAAELFLSSINLTKLQNIPEWSSIQTNIVEDFAKKLNSMLEFSSNWYKIWCVLIRLLDKEVLNTRVINTYLSIVEICFRSKNYRMRSEAFICWKYLIKIFAEYSEKSSLNKHIKLICIPLKSSPSKTPEIALNKFKAWWFFLHKLGTKNIEENLSQIFEPFLVSCFGVQTSLKLRPQIPYLLCKEVAIASFIEMFNENSIKNEQNEELVTVFDEVHRILESNGIEISSTIAPMSSGCSEEKSLISANILCRLPKLIINTAFYCSKLILENNFYTKNIFKILWKLLYEKICKTKNLKVCIELYDQLQLFLNDSTINEEIKIECFTEIIQLIGLNSEFPFKFNNDNENLNGQLLVDCIWNFTKLLILHSKYIKSLNTIDKILKVIYNLKQHKLYVQDYWITQRNLVEILIKNSIHFNVNNPNEKKQYVTCVELNLIIWKYLTLNIIECLNEFSIVFEIRQNERNVEIINEWILWPLNHLHDLDKINNESTETNKNEMSVKELLGVWKNLIELNVKKISYKFLKDLVLYLTLLVKEDKITTNFSNVIEMLISCLDNKFDSSSNSKEFFDLIIKILVCEKIHLKYKINIISSFNFFIKQLENDQVYHIFSELKKYVTSISLLNTKKINQDDDHVNLSSLKRYENEIHRLLLDKLKLKKNLLKEFKDMITIIKKNSKNVNNDEFVVIPTVWSLNPDKLTEHQKEKMKEKRVDIPALYNELSQSQDTNNTNTIKPWTPNKIIIKHNDVGSTKQIIIPTEQNAIIEKEITHEVRNEEQEQVIDSNNVLVQEKQQQSSNQNKLLMEHIKLNSNNENNGLLTQKSNQNYSESVLKTQRSPIKQKINIMCIKEHQHRLSIYDIENIEEDSINENNGVRNELSSQKLDKLLNKKSISINKPTENDIACKSEKTQTDDNDKRQIGNNNLDNKPKKRGRRKSLYKETEINDYNKTNISENAPKINKPLGIMTRRRMSVCTENIVNQNRIDKSDNNKNIAKTSRLRQRRKSIYMGIKNSENVESEVSENNSNNEKKIRQESSRIRQQRSSIYVNVEDNKNDNQKQINENNGNGNKSVKTILKPYELRKRRTSICNDAKNDENDQNQDVKSKEENQIILKSIEIMKEGVPFCNKTELVSTNNENNVQNHYKRRMSKSADKNNVLENSGSHLDENIIESAAISNKSTVDDISNTFNIQVENEKTIEELNSVQKDTDEGKTVVQEKLRRKRVGTESETVITKTLSGNDSDNGNNNAGNDERKKIRLRLSKCKSKGNDSTTISATLSSQDISTKHTQNAIRYENNQIVMPNNDNYQEMSSTHIFDKNLNKNEKQKTDNNDSSLEEIIGSSQNCEPTFSKRFILRKSTTPNTSTTTDCNISSPNKIKLNQKKQLKTMENLTVPGDLNEPYIPINTTSESHQKNTLNNNVAIVEPKMQELSISHDRNESMTLSLDTPRNDSTTVIDNNVSEMETELFNLSLVKCLPNSSSTLTKHSSKEVLKSFSLNSFQQPSQQECATATMSGENNLCEAETQPNTENFDSSKDNSVTDTTVKVPEEKLYLPKSTTKFAEPLNFSPMVSDTFPRNDAKSTLNKSILSSPEFINDSEKAIEFLNNTLNISPISTEITKTQSDDTVEKLDHATITENNAKIVINSNTSSPSRKLIKFVSNLSSSPPDRKQISATCSPAIKIKPASQLIGRGAQFINMIRNKSIELSPRELILIKTTDDKSLPNTDTEQNIITVNQRQQAQGQTNDEIINVTDNNDVAVVDPTTQRKDLLVFSKNLPSLNASPSTSILKRKSCYRDNSDETFESPIAKRKRVSFHDPPVSLTKEYIKHSEEMNYHRPSSVERQRPQVTRCLLPENTSTPQSLKRMSRADSMKEIEKFSKESPIIISDNSERQQNDKYVNSSNGNCSSTQTSIEMDTLKLDSINDGNLSRKSLSFATNTEIIPPLTTAATSLTNNIISIDNNRVTDYDDETSLTPSPSLYFPDDQSVFNYIFGKYSFDTITEKYLNTNRQLNIRSSKYIIKDISEQMLNDTKLKSNILELLSEKHSIDFLNHAIQENLSSTVCDKLNVNSIIDYIYDKSKINSNVRKCLLDRAQHLLEIDQFRTNKYDFIRNLLSNNKLSKDEILSYIQIMINKNNPESAVTEMETDNTN